MITKRGNLLAKYAAGIALPPKLVGAANTKVKNKMFNKVKPLKRIGQVTVPPMGSVTA